MNHEGGTNAASTAKPWHSRFRMPVFLMLFGLLLYLPGANWGLPGTVSWSQDTIAGPRSIGPVQGWPMQWKARYPPLQYFLNVALYQWPLQRWQAEGRLQIDPQTGVPRFQPPATAMLTTLFRISRAISIAMAIGVGLAIWTLTRLLLQDDLTALLAAMCMMCGAAFTYFAKLGNVDVPTTFWFAWATVFYAKLLLPRGNPNLLAALLGLFAGLAVATKDGTAGMLPGMALVLLIFEVQARYFGGSERRSAAVNEPYPPASEPPTLWQAIVGGVFQARWLIGIIAFALPVLLVNGLLFDVGGLLAGDSAFQGRVQFLQDQVQNMHYRIYDNQWQIAAATVRYAAAAIGWPLVLAMIAAVAHGLRRHASLTMALLLPALSYYAMFIMPVGFVYSRFLFPPLVLLSVLFAVAARDFLRAEWLNLHIRIGIALFVALPTLGYVAAVDVAMMRDSRYEAETWFAENTPADTAVGVFSRAQYLPRLAQQNRPLFAFSMTEDAFAQPMPAYLLLTSYNFVDFAADEQRVMRRLLDGELGYSVICVFDRHHLGTGSWWLSLAGWWAEPPGKISPALYVLRRDAETDRGSDDAQDDR